MLMKGKMDKTKKVVVILLILAVLFSAVSILINLSISSGDKINSQKQVVSESGKGNIGFVVEKSIIEGGIDGS